ncbi:MAG: IS110 family transposase [Solirubrobacterales bacterium]|nr:IS110 family transposase [Solirubrobacterales bacterium]MBV9424877.1 IS110 family transposase [Solirubrobacterales bacterium]
MIVIGVDTHKGSHALSAVDEGTGRVRGSREIKADDAGHLAAVRWGRGLDEERVWAIEDCRHVSRRFEQALLAAGERVIRVAPKMMGASRRGERERGKSDEIDAQAVARAVVKDGVDRFPAAYLDERAMEIRLISDHREDLVRERTRMQNRLRWHLLELCPELEAKLPPGALSNLRQLERLDRRLRRLAPSMRLRIAREELAHVRALTRQAKELERELLGLISAYRPRLLQEQGCGTLTAALLIGRTAGAQRFRSDACFGRQSGTAPIPCSTGQRTQHRLDPGGDRQLNRAMHTIAITRAHHDPATREYLARKRAEGKTDKGALRSLKRYLARHFWRLLSEPPLAEHTDTEPERSAIPPRPAPRRKIDKTIKGDAPVPMVCIS